MIVKSKSVSRIRLAEDKETIEEVEKNEIIIKEDDEEIGILLMAKSFKADLSSWRPAVEFNLGCLKARRLDAGIYLSCVELDVDCAKLVDLELNLYSMERNSIESEVQSFVESMGNPVKQVGSSVEFFRSSKKMVEDVQSLTKMIKHDKKIGAHGAASEVIEDVGENDTRGRGEETQRKI
ncbi:hypothetical protein LR48_Vigan08g109600 [Vigna angularis]|uniref:Uncharacterized protein n=1 Tax=Phaseolus angularis TaxID=3914 RepID=A0A0L9V6F2_PHAAN|nr:hypothetical protein LR48_Vigan08g109600 [Vigna angularis]